MTDKKTQASLLENSQDDINYQKYDPQRQQNQDNNRIIDQIIIRYHSPSKVNNHLFTKYTTKARAQYKTKGEVANSC